MTVWYLCSEPHRRPLPSGWKCTPHSNRKNRSVPSHVPVKLQNIKSKKRTVQTWRQRRDCLQQKQQLSRILRPATIHAAGWSLIPSKCWEAPPAPHTMYVWNPCTEHWQLSPKNSMRNLKLREISNLPKGKRRSRNLICVLNFLPLCYIDWKINSMVSCTRSSKN